MGNYSTVFVGRGAYGGNAVVWRAYGNRYFACGRRAYFTANGYVHNVGYKRRHMRNCAYFLRRRKRKRKAHRNGASAFQFVRLFYLYLARRVCGQVHSSVFKQYYKQHAVANSYFPYGV
jgi:hypothetical protein